MADQKLCTAGLKVGVRGQHGSALNETIISSRWIGMGGRTSIIQCREDSWGSSFFDQVANDLVIEVFDRRPLDLFSDIFFLLRLQSKLDEYLL